jgi:hypothetical protein
MRTGSLKRLAAALLVAALTISCAEEFSLPTVSSTPLADTLMTVFADMSRVIKEDCSEEFFRFVHPEEASILRQVARNHGYSSLRAYLDNQLRGWPEPDTLAFCGIVSNDSYARLALAGHGSVLSGGKPHIRYTFLLFRRSDEEWKLAAMAAMEKRARDLYGNVMTYHETDLPFKLRFPRLL